MLAVVAGRPYQPHLESLTSGVALFMMWRFYVVMLRATGADSGRQLACTAGARDGLKRGLPSAWEQERLGFALLVASAAEIVHSHASTAHVEPVLSCSLAWPQLQRPMQSQSRRPDSRRNLNMAATVSSISLLARVSITCTGSSASEAQERIAARAMLSLAGPSVMIRH